MARRSILLGSHRAAVGLPAAVVTTAFARATTNLQETNDLVWTLVAISAAGAIVTFSFLVYTIWRFRDPNVKGRRYG